jgi:hypothetical protein
MPSSSGTGLTGFSGREIGGKKSNQTLECLSSQESI